MAAANNGAGESPDLCDSVASKNSAKPTVHSLALRPLAAVIGSHVTAVGASKPGQFVQFDTTVGTSATSRI